MIRKQHQGFTLVELLVVLAVIAIISSISFGAFKSISEGNKRTSCQSNLSQVYKSVRLYAQDYEGQLPYLNENGDPNMPFNTPAGPSPYGANNIAETPKGGIGLWSLYTFTKPGSQNPVPSPLDGNTNCPADPGNNYDRTVDLPAQVEDSSTIAGGFIGLTGYVRTTKIFHCPADNFPHLVQYRDLSDNSTPTYECKEKVEPVDSKTLLIHDGDYNYLNPFYLSYQVTDDFANPVDSAAPLDPTYSSFRRPEKTTQSVKATRYRQITPYNTDSPSGPTHTVDRTIQDMTVLTWCRFHRSLDEKGATRASKRAFDNVLFSDGSVQSLPAAQVVHTKAGDEGTCSGWQRVPRDKTEDMLSVQTSASTLCVPSP